MFSIISRFPKTELERESSFSDHSVVPAMPPMKIQPIDIDAQKLRELVVVRNDSVKPVLKSRLKRLFVFDWQLPNAHGHRSTL